MKRTIKMLEIVATVSLLLMTIQPIVICAAETQSLPGWPVLQGNPSGDGHNSFVVGDVGFTPGNEAITISRNSHLYIFSFDGTLLLDVHLNGISKRQPSLGDLDGDGDLEIVVSAAGFFGDALYVIDEDTVTTIASGYNSGYRPVVLDDLDGNGTLEIIELEMGSNSGQTQAIIHVRDRFGNDFEGWPIQPLTPTPPARMLYSPLAVGDLDGDGMKEIVVQLKDGRTNDAPTIFAIRSNGSILWSYQIPYDYVNFGTTSNDVLYFNDVVLGDVDNDGFLEVVYFRNGKLTESEDSYGFIFDHEGNIQAEWTVPLSEAYFGNPAMQQIALGDIDQDCDLEIIMSACTWDVCEEDRTFAWHHTGELMEGFPIMLGPDDDQTTSPMIADVNNDGFPDIVSSLYDDRDNYYNRIYAWDRQGQLLDDWPKELIRQSGSPWITIPPFQQTTLVDLDGNGTLDLIAPIGGAESHAIDLGVPLTPSTTEWPIYRHDPQRTGLYIDQGTLPDLIIADFSAEYVLNVTNLTSMQQHSYKKIKLTAIIKNNGIADINIPFNVTFYSVKSTSDSISGTPISIIEIMSLGADETKEVTITWILKPKMQVFSVFADSSRIIEESDESNNWASVIINKITTAEPSKFI